MFVHIARPYIQNNDLRGTAGLFVGGLWTRGGSQFLSVRGSVDETTSI